LPDVSDAWNQKKKGKDELISGKSISPACNINICNDNNNNVKNNNNDSNNRDIH